MTMDKIEQQALCHNQLQNLLNAGVAHIRKQGHPALGEEGKCMYRTAIVNRGDVPSKCFIGGCIADEHYDPLSENKDVTHCGPLNMLAASGFPLTFVDTLGPHVLRAMQRELHDDVARKANMSNYTRGVVKSWGPEACVTTRDDDPATFDARWMTRFEGSLRTFCDRYGFTAPEPTT